MKIHRNRTFVTVCAGFITGLMLVLTVSCVPEEIPEKISDNYRNYYEIFVRSFYDSDEDGLGDLNGVTSKLDYITDQLGADGIWLMPIMPSPTYHKYDVTDYYSIDPQYGNMDDFDQLIAKAHSLDVKIIIDLVLNHTSNLHPWFQHAVTALWEGEESKYIGYYNFTLENPGQGYNKITDQYYYECRFVSGMPDLNLDNADVRSEMLAIAEFWLDKGVDGFRLDAVTSFYTDNTTKNLEFLDWLCTSIKQKKQDAYLVGEVWADGGTISNYYKSGLDSFFNFPFSQATGRIVAYLNGSNGNSFSESLANWNEQIQSTNPSAIDALFLSNHDNARSAGFLMRNLQKEKMAAAIYLLAPGNPFIYYGEELGMTGSGIDENKRLPMLWSLNDSTGIPFPPPNATQSVEGIQGADKQIKDNDSLLNYYRRILEIKAKNPEIARGTIKSIESVDNRTTIFSLTYQNNTVYVLHNPTENQVTLSLDGFATDPLNIVDYLVCSGKGKAVLKGNRLTLPPMSSVILR